MFRKKLILTAVIAAMTVSAAGCGNTASTESSSSSSAVETTTAAEETTTTVEPTTEETTTEEPATEAETTEAVTEAEAEGGIPTNQELLRNIISSFGILSNGSFEDDVLQARKWNIIGAQEEIMADAPATAEFLVSACVKAGSFADENATLDDIIKIAMEKGFIDDTDLSKIDLTKAAEFVEKTSYAWKHQTFDNEINVTLADGVIDLNNVISADDWSMDGDTITLSPEAAKDIKSGTVFILPKKSTGEGGAYKATAVMELADNVQISASPADASQVYGSIN